MSEIRTHLVFGRLSFVPFPDHLDFSQHTKFERPKSERPNFKHPKSGRPKSERPKSKHQKAGLFYIKFFITLKSQK